MFLRCTFVLFTAKIQTLRKTRIVFHLYSCQKNDRMTQHTSIHLYTSETKRLPRNCEHRLSQNWIVVIHIFFTYIAILPTCISISLNVLTEMSTTLHVKIADFILTYRKSTISFAYKNILRLIQYYINHCTYLCSKNK